MLDFRAIALLLLMTAVALGDEPPPDDLAGRWTPIRVENDGGREVDVPKEIWTFDKGVLTIEQQFGDRARTVKLTYVTNPKLSPKTFDWTRTAEKGLPEPGIYELRKGKLVLCYCSGGRKVRPKEIATHKASGPVEPSFTVYTLERLPEPKKAAPE